MKIVVEMRRWDAELADEPNWPNGRPKHRRPRPLALAVRGTVPPDLETEVRIYLVDKAINNKPPSFWEAVGLFTSRGWQVVDQREVGASNVVVLASPDEPLKLDRPLGPDRLEQSTYTLKDGTVIGW